MGKYEYDVSVELGRMGVPVEAFIMAAMAQADSRHQQRLRAAFPEVWADLHEHAGEDVVSPRPGVQGPPDHVPRPGEGPGRSDQARRRAW